MVVNRERAGTEHTGRVTTFVLVHSPLVGPGTWSRVAKELSERDHHTVVPSLVDGATTGSWRVCVDAVAAQAQTFEAPVLVGHSGAGPLLPLIADGLKIKPAQLVFVDAPLPPSSGETALVPAEFKERLRALTHDDGMLPKWSEWFGPDAMRALIPDDELRAAIVDELPRVPLSYFDAFVAMPDAWTVRRAAYILLSDIYREDAAEAAARGWPVIQLPGAHLDIVTRPTEIADALVELTATR
jgi:hypothetical protein